MSLGQQIKALRRMRGMTQGQLGKACGLGRTSITNIELGRQILTENTVTAIADALGFEVRIQFVQKNSKP